MKKKPIFVVILVMIVALAFYQILLSRIPITQTINLSVPWNGDDDEYFTATTTATYGWSHHGMYMKKAGGNQEGTSHFILYDDAPWDPLVESEIDIDDLPYSEPKVGSRYGDCSTIGLVWNTEYVAALTVSSSTYSMWDNHAVISNYEIRKSP
jgi:hypothetical protein